MDSHAGAAGVAAGVVGELEVVGDEVMLLGNRR